MLDAEPVPVASLVSKEEMALYTLEGTYRSTLDSFSQSRKLIREKLWKEIIDHNEMLPETIYGVHKVMPGSGTYDEQILFYGVGMTAPNINARLDTLKKITIEAGLYVQFTYQGPSLDFQKFILRIYHTCLPSLGLIRRNGMDIEQYHTNKNRRAKELPLNIFCDYMIPVRCPHEAYIESG